MTVLVERIKQAQLAVVRLLGTTRATIVYRPGIPCASIKTQTLYIPPIANDSEENIIELRGYVDHETLHLKHTTEDKPNGFLGDLYNLLEDCRIERLGGAEYAGVKANLTWNNVKTTNELKTTGMPVRLASQLAIAMFAMAHETEMTALTLDEVLAACPEISPYIQAIPPDIKNKLTNIIGLTSKETLELSGQLINLWKLQSDEKPTSNTKEFTTDLNDENFISDFTRVRAKIQEEAVKQATSAAYTANSTWDVEKKVQPDKNHLAYIRTTLTKYNKIIAKLKPQIIRRYNIVMPVRIRNLERGCLDSTRITHEEWGGNVHYKKLHRHVLTENDAYSILVDCSGSMCELIQNEVNVCKMDKAREATIVLSSILDQCRKPFEVLSFFARKRGIPAARYADVTRKSQLEHCIYKNFKDSFFNTQTSLARLTSVMGYQNVDGEAVYWAACRLSKRPEKRKILFVISDGQPADCCTGTHALTTHLHHVLSKIEKSGVRVIGIGVDKTGAEAVKFFYKDYVAVLKPADLTTKLLTKWLDVISRPIKENK